MTRLTGSRDAPQSMPAVARGELPSREGRSSLPPPDWRNGAVVGNCTRVTGMLQRFNRHAMESELGTKVDGMVVVPKPQNRKQGRAERGASRFCFICLNRGESAPPITHAHVFNRSQRAEWPPAFATWSDRLRKWTILPTNLIVNHATKLFIGGRWEELQRLSLPVCERCRQVEQMPDSDCAAGRISSWHQRRMGDDHWVASEWDREGGVRSDDRRLAPIRARDCEDKDAVLRGCGDGMPRQPATRYPVVAPVPSTSPCASAPPRWVEPRLFPKSANRRRRQNGAVVKSSTSATAERAGRYPDQMNAQTGRASP